MKRTITISLAVLISAFATIMSLAAALALIFIGSILYSRIFLQSKSLPQPEAMALKSSTAYRVGQVLIMVPLLTVIAMFVAMSGFLK